MALTSAQGDRAAQRYEWGEEPCSGESREEGFRVRGARAAAWAVARKRAVIRRWRTDVRKRRKNHDQNGCDHLPITPGTCVVVIDDINVPRRRKGHHRPVMRAQHLRDQSRRFPVNTVGAPASSGIVIGVGAS